MAPADDNTADLPRSTTAVQKRSEQLKRWTESETNKELSDFKEKRRRVAFQDDCVFLAACAAGEQEEVLRMLNRGSDINTANVDGLTALHQACIDDRIEMVKFLVEHHADINRGDNEGWTPLHATASCGYLHIAKYLIEHAARVDIVNNDGELPIDIADTDEMESLLQAEIHKQGVDIDFARSEEEQIMLKDAKEWYNGNSMKENVHPKTGATPLHVAAAKGYREVMRMLLELGVDIDARDLDGWTPLHAAAHWGHREGCRMLVEYGCDMEVKTNMGQLAADLCEADMVAFLEDLQKRQLPIMKEKFAELERTSRPIPVGLKRRLFPEKFKDEKSPSRSPTKPADIRVPEPVLHSKPSPVSPYQAVTKAPQPVTPGVMKAEKVEPKPQEAVKPISFLTPAEKLPDQKPITAVTPPTTTASAVSPVKPLSFLPTAEVKPISFLQPRESQFPLTSKLSPTEKPRNAMPSPTDKVEPVSFLRSENVKPVEPRPVAATVHHPPVPQTVQKTVSTPSTVQTTNKPLLPHMSSLDFIDDGPALPSPGHEPVVPAVPRERPSRLPEIVSPRWATTLEFPNTKPPLTHTQPVPPPRKVSPSEKLSPNHNTATSGSKTGLYTSAPSFFGTTPNETEASSTATVRRSFQPPARDEESEAQRKAHAKRVRETRRSTQGVSVEDLKAADAQAKQAQAQVAPDSSPTKLNEASSRDEEKENQTRRASLFNLLTIPGITGNAPDVEMSKSQGRPLAVPPSPDAVITLPLRKTKSEEDSSDQNNSRRRRPKRRSTGVVNIEMEDEEGSASGTDLMDISNKGDAPLTNGQLQSHDNNGVQSTPTGVDRSYTRSKYDTSTPEKSPAPSYRTSRTSSVSSASSAVADKEAEVDKDWKKLYEQEKTENEKLKKKLTTTEKELSDSRSDSNKSFPNGARGGGLTEAEKRERRAMERKIAELEEELKELETLRADNQRLKEENGALIRVISKLSK